MSLFALAWRRRTENAANASSISTSQANDKDDDDEEEGLSSYAMTVRGAGTEECNGVYHFHGYHQNACCYVKKRTTKVDGDNYTKLCIFQQCLIDDDNINNPRRRWFLSMVPDGVEPDRTTLVEDAIDFYSAEVNSTIDPSVAHLPPVGTWESSSRHGAEPAPILQLSGTTRKLTPHQKGHNDDASPSSPLPPAVTASKSGETMMTSSSSSLSHNVVEGASAPTTNTTTTTAKRTTTPPRRHIKLPLRTAPVTPDGLRPRRSTSLLRQELGVQTCVPVISTVKKKKQQPQQRRPFLTEKRQSSTAVLPPAPSSSWSMPNHQQMIPPVGVQVLTSPPISTSSFYSGRSNETMQNVAVSPHLLPGQARTAVGALVALNNHTNTSHRPNNTRIMPVESTGGYDGDVGSVEALHSSFQALPTPREWLYNDDSSAEEDDSNNKDDNEDAVSAEEEIMPYYPLDPQEVPVNNSNTTQQASSPFRPKPSSLKTQLSPISASSSLQASPSSLARPYILSKKANLAAAAASDNNDVNKSMSSAAGLLNAPDYYEQQNTRYDFGHVAEEEEEAPAAAATTTTVGYTDVVYAHPSDQTHVSAMSNSIPEHDVFLSSNSRAVSADDDDEDEEEVCGANVAYNAHLHNSNNNATTTQTPQPMDGALRRQKVQNQRRLREELVLAVVERLQDDVQLVADVEAIGHAATVMADWFVKTPLDRPGMLTGFSLEQRKRIMGHLTSVLDEMNVACPEDFFLSPSQVPGFAETHGDLTEALCFCVSLVQMAISQPEQNESEYHLNQGKWKLLPGLRPTLGIIPPDSPEPNRVRGGDTSVFTLPSDSADTPVTSHVSMTTTIESQHNSSQQFNNDKNQPDGLQIRRTIEIISTLLQRMSVACQELADMDRLSTSKSVRITKDIKNTYLQLIAMDHGDLRSLVDAFELELADVAGGAQDGGGPPMLSKLVSTDDDEQQQVATTTSGAGDARLHNMMIVPPPHLQRKSTSRNSSPVPEELLELPESSPEAAVSTNDGLFSPCTDDMKSFKQPFSRHSTNVVVQRIPDEISDNNNLHRRSPMESYNDLEDKVVRLRGRQQHVRSSHCENSKLTDDQYPEEFDDLRRQVGSNDHEDDVDDERDGPAEV